MRKTKRRIRMFFLIVFVLGLLFLARSMNQGDRSEPDTIDIRMKVR